jgi:hypothetical protein
VVQDTTRASSGDEHHENGVSSGKNPFSSGAGYHLLNHIDKPHRDSAPTSTQGNGNGVNGQGAPLAAVDEVELAAAFFNEAAHAQGFTPCGKLTPQIHKRLEKRLAEIGGLAEFKRAVSAIHLDDFLAGRVRLDGRRPFKLNLERLLRTEGGMGDVLAMLLGLADEAAQSRGASTPAQRDLADTLARMREEEDGQC